MILYNNRSVILANLDQINYVTLAIGLYDIHQFFHFWTEFGLFCHDFLQFWTEFGLFCHDFLQFWTEFGLF